MNNTPSNTSQPVKVPLVTDVWGVFKTLVEARKNVLSIIPELATLQPIISGRVAWVNWHMVMDPSAIQHMLRDNLENYPKSDVVKNTLEPAIGDSLFIAEGAHWRWQRRAAAPVFSPRNIANLAPIMGASADATCARLGDGSPRIDMYEEMISATFDVISDITFSGSDVLDSDEVHRAIDNYIEQVGRVSIFDVIGLPTWIPRPSRILQPSALKQTKAIANSAVRNRAASGPRDVPDLLDLLMAGEDLKTKRKMNAAELRDNLLTFIVAGHETTALTLSWALYLCAFDPEVQEKLRNEAQQVLNGRTATAEDCAELTYTKQVLNETLRLYPPAALISRTAQSHDVLSDRDIHPKDTVMIPIYALHRHHALWDNPDEFNPDRFGENANHDRFAFLPFGDGPRVCIAAQFAMTEAQIILATLISRYKFERIDGLDPKPVMVLTLRPEGGVQLKVSKV
ncbi:cytochrome P450 [Amylibacter kogurei]|uniref:Cytochrome P450 n=1 Tax=Paramylibacter kogurei TaxID=1889778 RepID=A0A2G5K2D3_9RHOB|nr:cytochrome P450 [Amylibacter kogurei]PIB23279.1 cytochrome P450 [Amylibacter kogurei]